MNEEFKFDDTIPSLTLEPELETAEVAPVQPEPPQPKPEEPVLSPAEEKMVADFAATIDVENTAQILRYGAGTQKKMADFSDAALANVRTQDLGQVGDLIVDVVGELKGFDADEGKGFLGFFRKQADKLDTMKTKFAKAEVNVAKIGDALQQHQVRLLKDSAVLDKMYQQNLSYFKELTMYILAGKKKLEDVRATELPALKAKAEQTGAQEDAQRYNDMAQMCDRFEKKIHDLELTRVISIQMGPQTRLLQNNDTLMVEKIQSSLVNTIPLWKSQMVLALGLEHSRQATAAQSAVTEMTNELLKKNADMLKMGTIQTAKEAERSIVDIETLQHTNQQLIDTLDEVLNIQREGAEKRRAAEVELGKIEGELKQKLMELRN